MLRYGLFFVRKISGVFLTCPVECRFEVLRLQRCWSCLLFAPSSIFAMQLHVALETEYGTVERQLYCHSRAMPYLTRGVLIHSRLEGFEVWVCLKLQLFNHVLCLRALLQDNALSKFCLPIVCSLRRRSCFLGCRRFSGCLFRCGLEETAKKQTIVSWQQKQVPEAATGAGDSRGLEAVIKRRETQDRYLQ